MLETRKLKQRREAAKKERDAFQPLIDEAYKYAIPFRRSNRDSGDGEKRVDQVFDHTAIDSAFRFAGKIQQDLWPAGEDNFELEPGPIVTQKADRDALAKELEPITAVVKAFFDDGDWDMAFHEMALDLSAGTGAILMNPSDDSDKLWEPISVPIDELILESGKNNAVSGIYWTRKMTVRELFDTWPDGNFSKTLKNLERQKATSDIEVHTDTIYDRKAKRWHLVVWCEKQDSIIHSEQTRTCPWLTPRYFRVPGETYGRGPVMLAMPTIKTLNTAARLQLQAAAIAMLGIYTAIDDGVFNPDLATLEPGAFWKVLRNGGAMGPSVSRFPDPRLDLSNLVIKDMQMNVKATLMDQALPPDSGAVRSATEIIERVKRLASDHVGAYGRLVKEVVVPAVKRVIELAFNRALLTDTVDIDQLLIRVRVKSPIALARTAERVQKVIQWIEMVLQLALARQNPSWADRIVKMEDALTELGRDLNVPERWIVSDNERQQMDERDQAAVAAAAAMAEGAEGMAA